MAKSKSTAATPATAAPAKLVIRPLAALPVGATFRRGTSNRTFTIVEPGTRPVRTFRVGEREFQTVYAKPMDPESAAKYPNGWAYTRELADPVVVVDTPQPVDEINPEMVNGLRNLVRPVN